MNTLVKEQNNLGGIAKIWLIAAAKIPSYLYSYPRGLMQLPINWAEDTWELTPVFQSGSYTQDMVQSPAGTYYENTVTFKIPKYTLDRRQFAADFANLLWAVLTLDQNGEFLLMGSSDYPMRVTIKVASGADISDLNHIAITVSGKSPILPLNIGITT
ncbi:MAG: hypothetical protein WCW62_14165 [Bacteroidales bacterium]|jgi:hypothetical protein